MMLLLHVVISLVGIAAGFVVVFGMFSAKPLAPWTAVFLSTTVATSATGFLLPADRFMPSHGVGIASFLVLAPALYSLYVRHLAGSWRRIYVITALMALYFNVFVLIVQSFQKVPALNALAPTGSEPPFAVAQTIWLVAAILLGRGALKGFQPKASAAAAGR